MVLVYRISPVLNTTFPTQRLGIHILGVWLSQSLLKYLYFDYLVSILYSRICSDNHCPIILIPSLCVGNVVLSTGIFYRQEPYNISTVLRLYCTSKINMYRTCTGNPDFRVTPNSCHAYFPLCEYGKCNCIGGGTRKGKLIR